MIDRALFIDVQVPRPDRHASSVRADQMLQMLRARGIAVDLATLVPPDDESHRARLDALGVTLLPWAGDEGLRAHIDGFGRAYGLILLAWSTVARRFILAARTAAPDALIVFDSHDVNHVREYREAKVTGNARTLRRAMATRAVEREAMDAADCTIAITDADAATLRALQPGAKVETVTMWSAPPLADRPLPADPTLLFVGHYGAPANHDAAFVLAKQVLPPLRERVPAARLILAGSDPNVELLALADPTIAIPGWQPRLDEIFARAAVFVAPLRFGSGLKGKLLQAMRHRVPIVASRVAAEGVGARNGYELLLADTPEAMIEAVERILSTPGLAAQLAGNAAEMLTARYARRVVEQQFDRALATRPRCA